MVKRTTLKIIGVNVLAIIVTLIYLSPIIWMVMCSFKNRMDIFAIPPKIIFQPTLANYAYLVKRGLIEPLKNSLILSLPSVFLATFICLFAAYSFSRFKIPGSNTMMFFVLSLRMFPPVAAVIPLFILYRLLGLVGTYPGMIITYTMFSMPLALWVIKGFIDEVPKSLDDAAKVDGFSTTATVLKIILPQLGAALAAVILLNLIFVWNEFLFIYILGGKALRTMPVAIYAGIYTEKGVDWEYVSSLSTIHILPIVVAAFLLQKYLTRGLTFGMRR